MNTYCIFCKGGRESVVIPKLEALGHATIAPFARQLFLKKESVLRDLPNHT